VIRSWIPFGVLGLWAMLTVGGQYLSVTPNLIHLDRILSTPGSGAWLGFDDLGRYIDERLIIGARTSFLVSFWVVGLSVVVGTLVGTVTAYLGGWWDRVTVQLVDIFLAFPGILLAIALAGLLGPGIDNVVIALTTVGWVGYARLSRAQVLSLKHREHVQAAEALGVIAEAGLSFLGLGVQPPEASWGAMIRDGSRYMLVAPHMVLAPGVAIFAVVLSVNLLGDRLRDRLDTRMAVETGNLS